MSRVDAAAEWDRLRQAGFVEGEMPAEAATAMPWYIRTMLGIAGWIGALFLLGFVGVGFAFVMKSAAAALVIGAAVCAVAVFLFRIRPPNDFLDQFAFAMSLAGQGLMLVGLTQFFGSEASGIALLLTAMQAVLFLLVPNFLHRVWSAAIGAAAFVFALNAWGLIPYTQALLLAVFSWAWLSEFSFPRIGAQLRSLGYGLALVLIFYLLAGSGAGMSQSFWMYRGTTDLLGGELGLRIGAALVGLIMIGVVWKLLNRHGLAYARGPGLAALAGALILGMVSIKAPGIGLTIVIVLLGFANGNRVLAGLGILGLLAYLSYYYYAMQITLLEKSVLLVCTGLALLGLRLVLMRLWPLDERAENPHA